MNSPEFEIVTTTAGAVSIRDNITKEIMHNPVGPWAEANALYINQSKLEERLTDGSSEELVIFDIGLGAASNALAAIHCFINLKSKTRRPLKIISFEHNLELLKFALVHANKFDHYQGFEPAVDSILKTHQWHEPDLVWKLRHGNFLDCIETEAERAHLVFFDPYSPKMNREMWTQDSFKKLYSKSRNKEQGGTVLFTYSQATPIRAAMLAAGFYVGRGSSTGLKSETTQAATLLSGLHMPLGMRWLTRWKASDSPYPFDCLKDNQEFLRRIILEHPQFTGLTH